MSSLIEPREEPTTYRILILTDMIKVSLVGIGSMLDSGTNGLDEGWFNSVHDLPQWAQERLSLLMMVDKGHSVEGVGRKISDEIFWVYA